MLITVHNSGRYVESAICSIRAQSMTDLELILVDDGSTDGSAEILRRHAAADARLCVISRPHGGIPLAANCGLAAARGRYVARMDADDEAVPNRLERQVAVLDALPDAAVLGSGMTLIDADGAVTGTAEPETDPASIRANLLTENQINHPTVLMRRDAVLAVGGYRPQFMTLSDYDLWLRLAEHHALHNLPDRLVRYRLHPEQISRRFGGLRMMHGLVAQHTARLRRAGRPDPLGAYSRIDAATLRGIGVSRAAIAAALTGPAAASGAPHRTASG